MEAPWGVGAESMREHEHASALAPATTSSGGSTWMCDLPLRETDLMNDAFKGFVNSGCPVELLALVSVCDLPDTAVWVQGAVLYFINNMELGDEVGRSKLILLLRILLLERVLTQNKVAAGLAHVRSEIDKIAVGAPLAPEYLANFSSGILAQLPSAKEIGLWAQQSSDGAW